MRQPKTFFYQTIRGAIKILLKQGWTQGASARDASGNAVRFNAPEACRFCAQGAIMASAPNDYVADKTIKLVERVVPKSFRLLSTLNDQPGINPKVVVKVLARAMTLAQSFAGDAS
jgi:hypothetical protein